MQLAKLEEQLLEELATSVGNILDNIKLIELDADEDDELRFSTAQVGGEGQELDRQRDVYRLFARDGSACSSRSSARRQPDVSVPLASFLELFRATLKELDGECSTEERIRRLTPMFERRCSCFWAARSRRPRHGLHPVHGMHGDLFQPKEWDFFLGKLSNGGDGDGDGDSGARVRGFPTWASPDRCGAFQASSLLPVPCARPQSRR